MIHRWCREYLNLIRMRGIGADDKIDHGMDL